MVVTEGFAGNIALKTAEGTARQFADYLRGAISQSIWSKIGYLLARPAFRMLRDKMDPRKSNGGVFLGLNGVVIKSHGGTDPEGFAAAIDVGYDMVRYELLAKIGETIHRHAGVSAADRGHRRSGLVSMLRSVVLGCGSYLPERVLTNEELAASVDTSDEWIVQRTGIRQRHIAADGEVTSDLAIHAAQGGARQRPCRCAVDRPDRAGDLDARQHLSGGGGVGAGRPRHHPRRGLRPAGGVLGLRLWHRHHRRRCCAPAPTSARW